MSSGTSTPSSATPFVDSLNASGGETGRLIAAFDWSRTSLGPIETWPQSLRTATGLLLRSPVPIVMLWNEDGVMLYNDAYSVFAGGRHPTLLGSKVREGWPEVADFNDNVMKVGLAGGTLAYTDQELTLHRHGAPEQVWMNLDYSPVPDETGRPAGVIAIVVETTQRVLAERRGEAERLRQQALLQRMPGFVGVLSGPDHIYTYVNEAYVTLSGPRDFIGYGVREVFPDLEGQGFYELLDQVYNSGESYVARAVPVRFANDDSGRFVDLLYEPIRDASGAITGIFVGGYDVTEAARSAEALRHSEARLREANETLEAKVEARTLELMETEAALRQSQKMEAVGQLTGGIAHDFNNMLAVVMGSLDLLGRRIGADDARSLHYVNAATEGAKRAANLTQRLLAFSRQQPLKPESVDVNKLVAGMSDLLRHSIGADIRLETVLAGGVWRIHVDPNQLESVIVNLCVNARDAMPGGGRLTIETQNAHLDARYVSAHLGVPAGQYVLVAITDTGEGMSDEIIAKAFDPFFTTKEVGKGTGLGLSQVYGFVKQSGGHIKIYSEPGEGTTIKIYLPRHVGAETEAVTDEAGLDVLSSEQREVILVVDDEPAVRQLSVDALNELGYHVLAAENAVTALQILQSHPEIVLLFTDIVMPEVSGRKLAEMAQGFRPDLKVLYTTGYTRNAVVHNGVVDQGVELIGKPFSIDELAARVRQLLDG